MQISLLILTVYHIVMNLLMKVYPTYSDFIAKKNLLMEYSEFNSKVKSGVCYVCLYNINPVDVKKFVEENL